MSEHWQALQDIFDEVCSLDEAKRRAVLDERCGDNEDLRRAAERLLLAHDRERTANAQERRAPAGARFGAWETTRLLARGGMGEVWLARRADGQHEQCAALKILSPYLVSPGSVERFQRERQLLARLDHPNIARLLDGGMTPQGEPYLVMEYVEGVRLDQYCNEHGLALRDRLELMLKVCAAVNSAHQHLVVHRDLKPANILVTDAAGGHPGEPKLLDFGIAKVIDPEGGLSQATTSLFLTPSYASPETLRGEAATMATDVYSLGVVLYELLTGRLPFDASKLSPAALVEAMTERDATRPSAVCQDRKVKTELQGDLDNIVLKALARIPGERYGSAARLADDIRRHLEGKPVEAVHGNRWYIAQKFIRRNALAVGSAAMLVLLLAGGLAGTLWEAHVARRERASAEQRFNDARSLANYLLFDLYDSVGKISGSLPVQADMSRRALEYLDRMASIRVDDPALRLDLAQGYLRLATVFGRKLGLGDSLGDNTKAAAVARKGLAVIDPLARQRPGDVRVRRTLASLEGQLGAALAATAQYDEAFAWLRKSAETSDRIAGSHRQDPASLQDAGLAWTTYGKMLSEKGGYIAFNAQAPLASLRKAVDYLEAALRIDPNNTQTTMRLAEAYESMGRIDAMPDPVKGIQDFSTGLTLLARLPQPERDTIDVRQVRARLLTLVGWSQGQLGRLKEALANLEEARSIVDAQAASDPENTGAQYRRVDLYRTLGLVHGYAGHGAESLRYLKQAVAVSDMIVARDTGNMLYRVVRAELQGRVANLLLDAGRPEEASPYAERSVAFFKKLGDSPDATPGQLMEAVRAVAETRIPALRDYPAALRFALRADQRAQGKNPAVLGYLAEAYALNNDYPKAVEAARRGLALVPPTKPGEPPSKLRRWLGDELLAQYQAKLAKAR
jgi:tetratricopeptide (TPR) repeat protein